MAGFNVTTEDELDDGVLVLVYFAFWLSLAAVLTWFLYSWSSNRTADR